MKKNMMMKLFNFKKNLKMFKNKIKIFIMMIKINKEIKKGSNSLSINIWTNSEKMII